MCAGGERDCQKRFLWQSFPRGRHVHTHTQAKRSWRPQGARAQAEAAWASGTSVLPWGTSGTEGSSHLTWRPLEPLRGQGHAPRRAGRQGMTRSDSIRGRAAVHGADRVVGQKQQRSDGDVPKPRACEHAAHLSQAGLPAAAPTFALQRGPGATGMEGREVEVQSWEIYILWTALPRMRGSLNH